MTIASAKTLAASCIAALALGACGSSAKQQPAAAQPGFQTSVERVDPPESDEAASEATATISPQDIVFFALDSATLSDFARRDLEAVATWMLENPERYVVIDAHADEQGSQAYNLDLSKRRASAVLERLLAQGVDRQHLILTSHGEQQAIDGPNAVNRRALVYATEPADTPES